MGERRFYDVQDQHGEYGSFEQMACRAEDVVLPVYDKIVKNARLPNDPDEWGLLSAFVAFQFQRTRGYRDGIGSVFSGLADAAERKGFPEEALRELSIPDENSLKGIHIDSMMRSIEDFSKIIASKDFLLVRPPEGRSFYTSDNPVVLHSDEPKHGIWGNIGLSVKGIQIYLPLSANLLLAIWCPSILREVKSKLNETAADIRRLKSASVLSPRPLTPSNKVEFDKNINALTNYASVLDGYVRSSVFGEVLTVNDENMDFYNSLQVSNARDFVICKNGSFELAERFIAKNGSDTGFQIQVN